MKTINEQWDKFFFRIIWQCVTSDPDLIWIALYFIGMDFIAPYCGVEVECC